MVPLSGDVVATPVPVQRGPVPAAAAHVAQLRLAGAALHAELERTVRALRLAGASWTVVAGALGVSRQAARRRWRYLDDEPLHVVAAGHGALRRAWFACPRTGLAFDSDTVPTVESSAAALRALVAS